ncbi:MAG: MarR family transcriptional regulator [Oscillospiraceae bacterium]|nr:MarR family transcriptional regulator [Oscillospiraceae bacterium]
MDDQKYDVLKLENQLCFPLYAAAKETVKLYRPLLEKMNLTYTQYIAMLVFWEHKKMNVKELGEKLYLDSGTLTPVLKSLEAKGYVRRYRSTEDERVLLVEVTEAGKALREEALSVPAQMACHVVLSPEERLTLYKLLYKLLSAVE